MHSLLAEKEGGYIRVSEKVRVDRGAHLVLREVPTLVSSPPPSPVHGVEISTGLLSSATQTSLCDLGTRDDAPVPIVQRSPGLCILGVLRASSHMT